MLGYIIPRGIVMSLKERVGANIRSEREKRGWSREKLAVELNVSEGAVRHWESGKNSVALNVLEEIAAVWQISPLELLVAPEHKSVVERHLKILSSLPEDQLKILENTLELLEKSQ